MSDLDLKNFTQTPHFVLSNQIDPIILTILRFIFLSMSAVFICLAFFGEEIGLEDPFIQIIFGVFGCVEFITALFLPRFLENKLKNIEYAFFDDGFGMRMAKNPTRLYVFVPYDCITKVMQHQSPRQAQLQAERIDIFIDREKHKSYPSGYWRNTMNAMIQIQNQPTHLNAKARIEDMMERL